MRKQLDRGKIDFFLRVELGSSDSADYSIDETKLKKLLVAIEQANTILGGSHPIDTLEVLRWPGVLQENNTDQSEFNNRIKRSFAEAIDSLVAMRRREGDELKRIILQKLLELETIVKHVRKEAPKIMNRQKSRLIERITEMQLEVDQSRFEQELVYLAQKSDIMEELDRLDMHTKEVRTTLGKDEAVGRRLDFLMQELNREANTLSSKALAANTSVQAVDLKVIIEQMREQVQNIE